MTIYFESDEATVHHGDCLDILTTLPDASVDAVVTDPPYGLEFMGKEWDSFKPGGKRPRIGEADGTPFRSKTGTPSWGASGNPSCANCGGGKYDRGPRRCSCDNPTFPNHMAGQMRSFQAWVEQWATECYRVLKPGGHILAFGGSRTWHRLAGGIEGAGFEMRDSIAWLYGSGMPKGRDVAKAIESHLTQGGSSSRMLKATELAGDGTPYSAVGKNNGIMGATVATERKTFEAATDEARAWVGWDTTLKPSFEPIVLARKPLAGTVAANVLAFGTGALHVGTEGRHPANVVLDESQAAALDAQSGELTSGMMRAGTQKQGKAAGILGEWKPQPTVNDTYGDTGGASRFFYTAKAGADERPNVNGVQHPTVKPLDLMRWLVRLVTPRGGVVLEPFAGSGTTVEAAVSEGFRCIAVEREAEYLPLIESRLVKPIAQSLFGDWDADGAA